MTRLSDSQEAQLIGQVGRYHVRRLKKSNGSDTLDIRERVESNLFSGYTRRGINIEIPEQLEELRKLLDAILQ